MRGQKRECVFVQLYLLLTKKKKESIYVINSNRLQAEEKSCVENKRKARKYLDIIYQKLFINRLAHINIRCILEIF